FRWDAPRSGRQYEFHQIGVELIGSNRLEADTEALLVAIEALRRLGLEGFTITLSHVDFFNGISTGLGLGEEDRRRMRELVDRKETEGLDAFLVKRASREARDAFCRLTALAGKLDIIEEARSLVSNEKSRAALEDLDRIFRVAEEIGIASCIDADLGDVGGLDYYTGLTFKIYAPGLGTALGRGGRYDQLLGNFGHPEPAVGFSLCLDWLAQILGPVLKDATGAKAGDAARLDARGDIVSAFKEATRLRSEGKRVEIE
ncbi:MAG TPA: ATP phosphoribosyltransferase regulatory subunit, partial [Blastocatellia bacterium]|nr:ATP phosphoribosyltransferase regulatory subunit [Blastocatellia bacterium]